jgi:hypothetical protein
MDKAEANRLLEQELKAYEELSYLQLQERLDELVAYEVKGPSGATYQVEIQVLWDDLRKKAGILVMGSIDDGNLFSLTSYIPLTKSILILPSEEP